MLADGIDEEAADDDYYKMRMSAVRDMKWP